MILLLASAPLAQGQTLPPPGDLDAIHRYIEGLAFDSDENRAMVGFNRLLAASDPYTQHLVTLYLHHEGDVRCRWVAGQLLARMQTPGAKAAMTQGLSDKLPLARMSALQAVHFQRPPDGFQRLITGLKDPAAVIRAAASDELIRFGDSRAVPYLVESYHSPHNEHKGVSLFVRHNIITALAQLGGPTEMPVFIMGMKDGSTNIQEASYMAALAVSGLNAPPPGAGTVADRWQAWYENWQSFYGSGSGQ